MKRFTAALVAAGVALVAFATLGYATPGDEHKVTICHRTNSVTNPYVVITVDYSGADGSLVHDEGNGDHTQHLGPVFDADTEYPAPHNGDQWGDIIPPYEWPGDDTHEAGSYPGLNWTEDGQAIYNNECEIPAPPEPTPTPTPTTPTPTPTPTTTPTTPAPTPTFGEGGGGCPANDVCEPLPKTGGLQLGFAILGAALILGGFAFRAIGKKA